MAKKTVKKCSRCGIEVKSYSYGDYCSSCAEEVWDSGFESTTQHAEEIYEMDLKKKRKINKLLSNPPAAYDTLFKLIEYKSGTFRCKKCGTLRLNWIHFGDNKNKAKLKKMLDSACPNCNERENFIFD